MSKVAYRRKKKDLPKRKIEKKSGMNDLAVTPSCPALPCPVLFPYERVSFSTNNNLNQAQQKPEQIFPLPSKTEGPKKVKKKKENSSVRERFSLCKAAIQQQTMLDRIIIIKKREKKERQSAAQVSLKKRV